MEYVPYSGLSAGLCPVGRMHGRARPVCFRAAYAALLERRYDELTPGYLARGFSRTAQEIECYFVVDIRAGFGWQGVGGF